MEKRGRGEERLGFRGLNLELLEEGGFEIGDGGEGADEVGDVDGPSAREPNSASSILLL